MENCNNAQYFFILREMPCSVLSAASSIVDSFKTALKMIPLFYNPLF